MINPLKNSVISQNQIEKDKKNVSWGGKEIMVLLPIPLYQMTVQKKLVIATLS